MTQAVQDEIEAEQSEDRDIGDRERDEEDQRCLVDLRDGLSDELYELRAALETQQELDEAEAEMLSEPYGE
jgi:hypothetical protein